VYKKERKIQEKAKSKKNKASNHSEEITNAYKNFKKDSFVGVSREYKKSTSYKTFGI